MLTEKLGCRVTYIGHSGFFVEWEDCCFLFDYYEGTLPEPLKKPLFIFSSHSHDDHFNPKIFDYGVRWEKVHYILSDEIDLSHLSDRLDFTQISLMGPDERISLAPDIEVSTLRSTDLGVAFFVRHQGKTLYHAGDLHWWLWHECTREENDEMTQLFQIELAKCTGVEVDLAFLPLDPRQRSFCWMGMDAYMRQWNIKRVFPMHFWNVYAIIHKMKNRADSAPYAQRIITIERKGQEYEL